MTFHLATYSLLAILVLGQTPGPKPTSRDKAEDRPTNLSRYKVGGFGANATATLGVKIVYPTGVPQGVTISSFDTDSPAFKAGVKLNDWILEVDGSAVGLIRNRYYELWPKYGRNGDSTTEVLVSYEDDSGDRKYYYLQVATATLTGTYQYKSLPPDFFTTAKKVTRDTAETRDKNVARYVIGVDNFNKYSPYELGVSLSYSEEGGATILTVNSGSAADKAGLRVGDHILEVDGAPIGQFGDRAYEVWKQYSYSKDDTVEMLIGFPDPGTGELRYFYPQVKLDKRTSSG